MRSRVSILGLAVAALGMLAPTASAQDVFTNPANGHRYYITLGQMTWADAEAHAVSAGGHLVAISSLAEQEWMMTTFGNPPDQLWIGFTDRAVEGTWVWTTGEPVTFTAWHVGEPNDFPSSPFGEDFAVLWYDGAQPDGWVDYSGEQLFRGIVEIADCSVAPTIDTQPGDATVGVGAIASFHADVSVDDPAHPASFRWRKDSQLLNDDGRVTGTTTDTLRIQDARIVDRGRYDLLVTNTCGSALTRAALLRVQCLADFNHDGFVDFFDADDFITCFEGAGCLPGTSADFNGDGFVDFFDLDAFIAAFERGC